MTNNASNPTQVEQCTLRIIKTLNTSCDIVFDYFTKPEHLSQWFAPDPSMTTEVRKLDLNIGGQYEIAMINESEGNSHVVVGEYQEIDRPSRLVYTWHWKSEPGKETSRVTINLTTDNGQTRLDVCHDRFDDPESCNKHGQGWEQCLNRLVPLFT